HLPLGRSAVGRDLRAILKSGNGERGMEAQGSWQGFPWVETSSKGEQSQAALLLNSLFPVPCSRFSSPRRQPRSCSSPSTASKDSARGWPLASTSSRGSG